MVGGSAADGATLAAAARAVAASFDPTKTATEALARVAARGCDVLIVEDEAFESDDPSVRAVLEEAKEATLIVVCRRATFAAAAAALRHGATAVLASPVSATDAEAALRAAVETQHGRDRIRRLREAGDIAFGELVGESAAMRRVQVLLARLCDVDKPVLIGGEPGTGKELVARALHARSARRAGPFVTLRADSLHDEDAPRRALLGEDGHGGLIAAARGGTLFLRGVDATPVAAQAPLARALREARTANGSVDVRIMASTTRNLANESMAVRFREDLRQEVDVMNVLLPPLRDRDDDVHLIAMHFLRRDAAARGAAVVGFRDDALTRLAAHAWPGNVGELENAVAHAVAVASHDHISVGDLPASVTSATTRAHAPSFEAPAALVSLEELQSRYILHVLRETGGNRNEAASILGLDRTTLWRRLERMRRKSGAPPS